jgi:monothiol glutaredoxin
LTAKAMPPKIPELNTQPSGDDNMDIQEVIKQQVTSHPVVVYMKGTPQFPQCGFSGNVIRILNSLGVKDIFSVNILQDDEIRKGIIEYANWPTVPQVYIGGEFIGGSDITTEMYQSGELKEMLSKLGK